MDELPTINEIDSGILEVELIVSRHDGVHNVHSIIPALKSWRILLLDKDYLKFKTTTDAEIRTNFNYVMREARYIDKHGSLQGFQK